MNELIYNFINQIEDVNRIKEMSIEEFAKLVKSNKLISEEDANKLIESFKKISSQANFEEDATDDSEQRKKKYRSQQQVGIQEKNADKKIETKRIEKEVSNKNSIER